MMTLISLVVGGALLAGPQSEQGSGVLKKKSQTLSVFKEVDLRGAVAAVIKVGNKPSVTLEIDDNLFDHVAVTVDRQVLVVETKGSYSSKTGLRATIYVPVLEGVAIRGSGSVLAQGVEAKNLSLAIDGSGTIEMSGRVSNLSTTISGSGTLKLAELRSQDATVSIAGSGDVAVHASRALTALITGAGSVVYRGNPKVTKQITGSGSVRASK